MIIRTLHKLLGTMYRGLGFASRYVAIRGHTLHYYESRGEKRNHTRVILHGLGTSASTWAFALPTVRALGRVIALDLPGFGRSRTPEAAFVPTFADHLAILHDFLCSTVPESMSLVGHSLGGWLAMLLALENPDRVRKLVLLNPAGVWYEGCEQVALAFDVHSTQDTRRLLERLWFRFPWFFRPFLGSVHNELRSRRVFDLVRTIRREEFVNERHLLPGQVSREVVTERLTRAGLDPGDVARLGEIFVLSEQERYGRPASPAARFSAEERVRLAGLLDELGRILQSCEQVPP